MLATNPCFFSPADGRSWWCWWWSFGDITFRLRFLWWNAECTTVIFVHKAKHALLEYSKSINEATKLTRVPPSLELKYNFSTPKNCSYKFSRTKLIITIISSYTYYITILHFLLPKFVKCWIAELSMACFGLLISCDKMGESTWIPQLIWVSAGSFLLLHYLHFYRIMELFCWEKV